MRSCRISFVAILTASLAAAAFAEEFPDPAGYSMWYPNDWVCITKVNFPGQLEPMKKWVTESKTDLEKLNVVFVPGKPSVSGPAVKVIVVPVSLQANEKTADVIGKQIPAQLKAAGMEIDDFKCGVEKVAETDAIVSTFKVKIAATNRDLKQRQIYFPANDKTLIITQSAYPDEFDAASPIFEKMTGSIKIVAPK